MRLASLAENAFNSVERINEYTVAPEEPPADLPGACPDSWPSKGEVRLVTRPLLLLCNRFLVCFPML